LELLEITIWLHVGIYTVPFNFSVNFNLPLVIFGQNPQFEYGGPEAGRDNLVMDRALKARVWIDARTKRRGYG